jgi:hypothetical protein
MRTSWVDKCTDTRRRPRRFARAATGRKGDSPAGATPFGVTPYGVPVYGVRVTAVAPPAVAPGTVARIPVNRRVLPAITVALCSALLFLVEPLTAKLLLPLYGGSAAVWTGSVLFFQVVLLAGYGCVHGLLRLRAGQARAALTIRLGLTVVLLALPALVLPLHVPGWAAPGDRPPLAWLLLVLTVMVGLPFLALSVAGPLVSSWLTRDVRRSPYRLYAASNAGAIGGLVAYPLIGEPLAGADALRRIWSVGYVLAAVLIVTCAVLARRSFSSPAEPVEPDAPDAGEIAAGRSSRRERLTWLTLAALPVSLMLGTTTVLTTDVAPVPLLWVVPLALYLLTLTVAFAPAREGAPRPDRPSSPPALIAVLALAAVGLTHALPLPNLVQIAVDLVVLTVTCLAAHRRLAVSRPPTRRLTEFYLVVALGGALGGAFNSLVAPVVFVRPSEYPLALLAAIALLAMTAKPSAPPGAISRPRLIAAELGALAVPLLFLLLAHVAHAGSALNLLIAVALLAVSWLVAARRPQPLAFGIAGILLLTTVPLPPPEQAGRNFYGSYAVNTSDGRRLLTEGTTVHGFQYLAPDRRDTPTSYYATDGPIGQVFTTYRSDPVLEHVGIVGLGIGTLAAYGQPGQAMRFYELDPQIERVARDPALFSYLADSRATTSVAVGDGRLLIGREPAHSVGLLVLDAFASDAIPTHLLTAEAFAGWSRVLEPDGLIAVHITNRYLDLAPVLAGAARGAGMAAVIRDDPATGDPTRSASRWVVLAQHPQRLDALRTLPGWRPLPGNDAVEWTDDSSSLLPLFRLHGSG